MITLTMIIDTKQPNCYATQEEMLGAIEDVVDRHNLFWDWFDDGTDTQISWRFSAGSDEQEECAIHDFMVLVQDHPNVFILGVK